MDLEQTKQKYKELVDKYGTELPNPIQEPKRFEYYVKIMEWNQLIQKLAVDSKPKE